MKSKSLKVLVLAAAFAAVLACVSSPVYASQEQNMQVAMQSGNEANSLVQQAIQSKFTSDLNFAETDLSATVTDDAVVLSGRARDEVDHDRALTIAQSNAGNRRVVDDTRIERLYQVSR
jgi:osmotically-inducible protein OsmY